MKRIQGTSGSSDDDIDAAATAKSLQSCPTLCDPIDGSPPGSPVPGTLWPAAYQAPPSMGFSRQEYWSGVPLTCGLCLLSFYS